VANYEMTAADVVTLMRAFNANAVDVCLSGGWAIDALLGEQTRQHSDLDLWLQAPAFEGAFRVFVEQGVDRIHPWPGDRPWNFVLHDGRSRRVDLHCYETFADGSIQYGSILDPFSLPATALSHKGIIDGVPLRCEEPSWALSFHTGYPPRSSDRHDVTRLCERFDLDLPADYR
jgi:lincosamide nucleotidyltransferase A/C/D/E